MGSAGDVLCSVVVLAVRDPSIKRRYKLLMSKVRYVSHAKKE